MTQYSCDFTNLAPPGCTQYFFGSTTGTLRSFNYNGGQGHQARQTIFILTHFPNQTGPIIAIFLQLANQQQTQCVRRERSFCRICYFAAMDAQFDVSGSDYAWSGLVVHALYLNFWGVLTGLPAVDAIINVHETLKKSFPHTEFRQISTPKSLSYPRAAPAAASLRRGARGSTAS